MFVLLPRTVAFKTHHNLFFRRVRGVIKAEINGYELILETRRGRQVHVPTLGDTIVVFGRLVRPTIKGGT